MEDYKTIILNTNTTAEERIQAAFYLENQATPEAIKALGKALLNDPSPIVRHECAFSLGETAAPQEAGPLLQQAIIHDTNIFVIHEALLALGTLGDLSFIPFIKNYITDPRPEIAESATIALERLQRS